MRTSHEFSSMKMTRQSTPASQGYRMPAEWEPHSATWLTWPHNNETWPGQDMKTIENVYLEIIRRLQSAERTHILVNDPAAKSYVDARLKSGGLENSETHIIPTNDSWIRDYGPNFIARDLSTGKREIAVNKWKFDSWGEKYEWEDDNRAGDLINDYLGLNIFDPGIVLEPGGIEVNGQGTCIATEDCLLNPNRNGGLSRNEMETILQNYLGVTRVIWCRGEIAGDDTDGHIDNLVRFVNANTVLCASENDPSDANYPCLKKNLEIIEEALDQDGGKLNIELLPMPEYVGDSQTRLPASYANFYIGSKTVLMPTFDQPSDSAAHAILQKCFPDREVADIPCKELIWGLGGVHCITQQQPAFNAR